MNPQATSEVIFYYDGDEGGSDSEAASEIEVLVTRLGAWRLLPQAINDGDVMMDGVEFFEPEGGKVPVDRKILRKLLETFWEGQWGTRNAAENTVCSYGCGEPFEDADAHDSVCEFVKEWRELEELRRRAGVEYEVKVR